MLTDGDKINGLPVRTEIRTPRSGKWGPAGWLSSVVVCHDVGKNTYVVWSVYQSGGVHAENGIYDIADYAHALERAYVRALSALT